jgi:hypothetical protein
MLSALIFRPRTSRPTRVAERRQKREQRLTGAHQVELGGGRARHLGDELGLGEDFGGVGGERRAGSFVRFIGERGGIAGAALNQHRGVRFREASDRLGHERYSPLARNGLRSGRRSRTALTAGRSIKPRFTPSTATGPRRCSFVRSVRRASEPAA